MFNHRQNFQFIPHGNELANKDHLWGARRIARISSDLRVQMTDGWGVSAKGELWRTAAIDRDSSRAPLR